MGASIMNSYCVRKFKKYPIKRSLYFYRLTFTNPSRLLLNDHKPFTEKGCKSFQSSNLPNLWFSIFFDYNGTS